MKTDFLNPKQLEKLAAFAAIYFVWGSTYLAIRFLDETLPALTMVGMRFVLAGLVMYVWARLRGVPNPGPRHWRTAATSGVFLICLGNGGVVWGVQHMDSGLVALLVGTEPLWLALLIWLWPGGRRPSLATAGALLLGFSGAALLAVPGVGGDGGAIDLGAVVVVLAACVAWGVGSLYSRDADLPSSPWMVTSIQMLVGGAALITVGLAAGEWRGFEPQAVSIKSILAFAYLVVFGSLVAFSAFSWLIRTTEPTLVSTHTYVNPVVAVFLGWLIAGEQVGPRTLIASALILGAVFVITTNSLRRREPPAARARPRTPAVEPREKLERCA